MLVLDSEPWNRLQPLDHCRIRKQNPTIAFPARLHRQGFTQIVDGEPIVFGHSQQLAQPLFEPRVPAAIYCQPSFLLVQPLELWVSV